MELKTIKIFLASSITEFSKERTELEAFTNALNKTYTKQGIFFELVVCEDLSNSVQMIRMQETYNQEIRDSQYFYVIFGHRAGRFTVEEFEVALTSFRNKGMPKIYTYFQLLPEGQTPEQTVQDFMERLDQELHHYYSQYTHIDTIKLNLLMELCRDPQVGGELTVENGRASLNGAIMMSMENIPLFSKNEAVQKLLREQQEYEAEFADLAGLEDSEAVQRMRYRNSTRRNEIATQLHAMEMDMLGLCRRIEQNRQLGKALNWREVKAMELVDTGDYEAAKTILRDEQWQTEVARAEEIIAGAADIMCQYISGQKALIQMLKATGINEQSEKEIIEIYEKICDLAARHRIEINVLYDYADFLYDQDRCPQGIVVAEKLLKLYTLDNISSESYARIYRLLGWLYYYQTNYQTAEQYYRQSLELFQKLTKNNPTKYSAEVARTSHSLASLLKVMERYDEAESLLRKTLEIHQRLMEDNPEEYENEYAASCKSLALLLVDRNQYQEAEALLMKAMAIRQKNADDGRDALADCCSAIANLYTDTNRFEEAEALYIEQLNIYRSLAQENPAAYMYSLRGAFSDLAGFYWQTHRLHESQEYYEKTVQISRRLMEENPEAYENIFAGDIYNIALVLSDIGEPKAICKAMELCEEASGIFRRLAERVPDVYLRDVAACCNSMAHLLEKTDSIKRAEELLKESLSIYRTLAETNPIVYDEDIAKVNYNLALLLSINLRQNKEAEQYCLEALQIYRQLCEKNPVVYEAYVATCCTALGAIYWDVSQFDKAELLLREAVQIYRHKIEENESVYEADLALSCNVLGVILREIGQYDESEALIREAMVVFSKLSKEYPDANLPEWRKVRNNLVDLLKLTGRDKEAEQLKAQGEP